MTAYPQPDGTIAHVRERPDPRIVGIDPGTKTGFARPDGTLTRFRYRTPPAEKARRLHEATSLLVSELRRWPPLPDLAVVEGATLGGPGVQSKLVLEGFRCVTYERLHAHGCAIVEVKPSQLKRYATGNGKADKAQMIAAAEHEGAGPDTDDEADAYWCWHLGQVAYGLRRPTWIEDPTQRKHLTEHRIAVCAALTWPRIP